MNFGVGDYLDRLSMVKKEYQVYRKTPVGAWRVYAIEMCSLLIHSV